ncbi:hypothetical protein [Streptomyces sp. NPDC057682]|uniref:hypothetical protein n=1 Tax=unclassified Streptomyces TaxID=2593676 RepID=UPI003669C0A7
MPPRTPASSSQPHIERVLICFDAYDRARGAGNRLLPTGRDSRRDEQRAFDELRRAMEELRGVGFE